MERRYRGILFDLDGVICYTDQYHYRAWKTVADRLDIYFDEAINNRLRGVSRMESLEIILERYDGVLIDAQKVELATEKNEIYKRLLSDMTPADLPEAVRKTLPILRERGFALAIGSSSRNTQFILSRIGLEGFFDAVSDGNNITRSKPDPEVFLKAAQYLSLAPAECLVVEDAKAGIDAAIAGGFDSAAMGDAVKCGLATYALDGFDGLLDVCREPLRV